MSKKKLVLGTKPPKEVQELLEKRGQRLNHWLEDAVMEGERAGLSLSMTVSVISSVMLNELFGLLIVGNVDKDDFISKLPEIWEMKAAELKRVMAEASGEPHEATDEEVAKLLKDLTPTGFL